MSLTLILVRTPDALSPEEWGSLHSRAPGTSPEEVLLQVDAAGSGTDTSGTELAGALRSLPELHACALSCAGRRLEDLEAGSIHIHPGMVVVAGDVPAVLRGARGELALCVDTGPDAGRILPLRRGRYTVGRGQSSVRVADLAVSRHEGILDVGRTSVRYLTDEGESTLSTHDTLSLGASSLRLVRTAPEPSGRTTWPPAPGRTEERPPEGKHRMLLAMACIPLVIGIVMVAVTGMWFFLLFSAASALVAGVVVLHAGRRGRRFRAAVRNSAEDWGRRTERVPSPGRLAELLAEEPELHTVQAGGVHDVPTGRAALTSDVCPAVRIGMGRMHALVDFDSPSTEAPQVLLETQGIAAVPLTPGEVTTLVGERRDTERCMRWLLLQLLLSFHRVPIAVAQDAFSALPEETGRARGVTLLRSHEGFNLDRNGPPGILFADGMDPEHLESALRADWHVIMRRPSGTAPPGLQADLNTRTILRQENEQTTKEVWNLEFDGMAPETLQTLLRRALPHSWAGGAGAGELPETCRTKLPPDLFAESAQEHLVAELGQGRSGPSTLDLVGDGPHLLIGGTTGSGKSELVKTLMLSLACRYGPEELNCILFDFKGGATFHQLNQLEHSLGLVTDLSQAQAERTLESIRSELIRREKLFLDADAGDYGEYRSLCPEPPLARIVVVIDEFRIFAHELPETMDELMRIATLGRSLGLHLILSTQRPQGVVTADIRANIGTTMALRVRTDDESRELIGTPDAAAIPSSLPGRAVLRRGGATAELFQTAQVSPPDERMRAAPASQPSPAQSRGTPVRSIVSHLTSQLAAQGRRRQHSPLLPPLQCVLAAEDGGSAAQLGLVDLPLQQRQQPLVLDPHEAQTFGITGEPDAGGGRALAAAARQLAHHPAGPELHLVDGDGSLADLAGNPSVASYTTPETMPETERLIHELRGLMSTLRLESDPNGPPLVLIISGYRQLHPLLQSTGAEHELLTLAGEGPAAGLSVLVSGGRELVMGKLGARLSTMVYLPFGASEDTRYLWPKLRSVDPRPGRGRHRPDHSVTRRGDSARQQRLRHSRRVTTAS
ncbi:FtsK/SpoIIIE domain-containing protein [Nesterenkonia sp. NBAIMH1]|uniref:FtsK/SpoIIIE domain-containing protein n=1 Tax=Nesterenkonia sp. NBAIMH1 TaxID=2600320 RepID=UPI00143D2463|nr:FtsK/SpoIIIE domain-containing protein [Nesterenkonia sp. NBAIMH1]